MVKGLTESSEFYLYRVLKESSESKQWVEAWRRVMAETASAAPSGKAAKRGSLKSEGEEVYYTK